MTISEAVGIKAASESPPDIVLDVKTLASDSPEPGLHRLICTGDVDLCRMGVSDSSMSSVALLHRPDA